jgi:hypothetical protein
MKWFFTILILIIAIFFYIFAVDKEEEKKVVTLDKIDDSLDYIEPLSIDKNRPTLNQETLKSIPQEQTFDTIKTIIEDIKGRKISITLNSTVSSYIYSNDEKSRFKNELSKSFNIDLNQIEQSYNKNRLIWDWVNQLKD